MKTHRYIGLLIIGSLLLLGSCGTNNKSKEKEPTTIVYVDDYEREITVPTSPTRIVSTSPAITQIVFALGGENLLVGRTDYCTYPTEAQKIESIGGISNLNNEKVLSLNPDLVISGSMIPKKNADQLDQMGVPLVCIIEKQDFEGLYNNITQIGGLINKEATADSLIKSLREELETLSLNTSKDRPTIYYVVGFGKSGNFTAGGNSFINNIIEIAGAENIAKDVVDWSYSLEKLMQKDPDYILIRQEDSASFCNMAPYKDLTAVKKGNVIAIESNTIDLQVPRNIEAIKHINKAITK